MLTLSLFCLGDWPCAGSRWEASIARGGLDRSDGCPGKTRYLFLGGSPWPSDHLRFSFACYFHLSSCSTRLLDSGQQTDWEWRLKIPWCLLAIAKLIVRGRESWLALKVLWSLVRTLRVVAHTDQTRNKYFNQWSSNVLWKPPLGLWTSVFHLLNGLWSATAMMLPRCTPLRVWNYFFAVLAKTIQSQFARFSRALWKWRTRSLMTTRRGSSTLATLSKVRWLVPILMFDQRFNCHWHWFFYWGM